MNKRRRDMWFGCLYEYLKVSSRASQIVMCVNGEHGLKPNDVEFLKRTHEFNLSIQVVLTKIDKIREDQLYYRMIDISKQLDNFKNITNKLFATSSKTLFGIDCMRNFIVESLDISQQRNIDNN
jgi:GTP-binding protein EngB required for normal cell division